jgi:hypothetical protein
VQKLGEERVVYAGTLPEVMFNNEGKGFMHKARVDCTLFNDVNKGHASANGTCVVTDADGDNIFVEWRCSGVMPSVQALSALWEGPASTQALAATRNFRVTS